VTVGDNGNRPPNPVIVLDAWAGWQIPAIPPRGRQADQHGQSPAGYVCLSRHRSLEPTYWRRTPRNRREAGIILASSAACSVSGAARSLPEVTCQGGFDGGLDLADRSARAKALAQQIHGGSRQRRQITDGAPEIVRNVM
jgi:hypothetical protein